MNRLPPLLANMAQITPRSRASAALLIAILAVVLFTGPPASAQSENEVLNQVTVSFRADLYIVQEGGTRSINVYLSDDPGREVIIPITATNLGGAIPADYSGVPQTVTFGREDKCYDSDGDIIEDGICYETTADITITAAQDDDDDGESVLLGFGAPLPAGVSAGWPATETVTISDGGLAFVGLAQVGIGVTAAVGVLFGNVSNEAWQWQRSATEYGAYSDIPAAEGGTSNPYTPSASDLGMWLKAKITYDVGSSTGQTAQATTLQPVLSQAVLSNAGFAHANEVSYLLDTPPATPITPLYAQGFTTGSDTNGYLLTAVRLAIRLHGLTAAGAWAVHADDAGKPAAQPLSAALPILNPAIHPEHFTFREFAHPDGVRVDPDTKYWIVIWQTTPREDGTISIDAWSEWTGTLEEGLAAPPVDPGSADGWSVDFEALSYYWDAPNLDDDDILRPDLLPWQRFGYGVEIGGRMVLRMALRVAPEVTVQFSQDSYTVAEGGTQSVTVTLSADPERTVTIPIEATYQGGATSADYSGVPSSVTFNDGGPTEMTFTFMAVDDTLDDDDESVKLAFGTLPDEVSAVAPTETTFVITDDDDPFVTVEFGASAYTVAESDDTTTPGVTENEAEVTVTLSADPERTLIIPIETMDRGGATTADYSGVPETVTFNAGDTSKSFTFAATQDTVDDDDEGVLLEFGTMPDERVSAGPHAEAMVAITDDDHPEVEVQFGQDSQGVGEGETVNVTVSLSANPERSVTIPITATGQGGASSADYSVPANVTFNDGETEKTIAFMATEDTDDDDDESVKLGFGTSLPDRVTAGTRTETTLNIGDDDDPAVTVQFDQSAYTVAEGGTQSVTVTLSADPERTIIIPITPTPQGTVSAADYSGVPPSVTFNDGDTSKSFTFSATQDVIDDDGEGVKLGFGTMPDPRVSAGTTAELTLSITDDDTADIVLSPTSLTVIEEGASGVSYTVALATEPTVDVTVTISGHAGTDLNLGGGRLSNDTLTFTPVNWDRPQTVTVAAAHDDDGVTDAETLTHTAAGGEYAGVARDLPATVADNDPLGISITPLELKVDESDSADYAVWLDTEPTVEVTVTISGHAGTDLILSGPTLTSDALTFTADNWGTPQTVTVTAAHDDDTDDDTGTLTNTAAGGEYEGFDRVLPVTTDDNTGDLRLVDGTLTTEDGRPCEGRLEIYYDGAWGTICDDYWTTREADVACRALGFIASVEDAGRYTAAYFGAGAEDQEIVLDDLNCNGDESGLLECPSKHPQPRIHNCRHSEDVGLRCLKPGQVPPWVVDIEFGDPPGGNGAYDEGETLDVTLVWSEPVTVSSPSGGLPPKVWIAYGSHQGLAEYARGSGTDRTVFSHTVQAGSHSLARVPSNTLRERDGSIVSAESGMSAALGHTTYRSGQSGQSGDQAEAATIIGVPVFNDPGPDNAWRAGESVEVIFTFSQPVQVDTTGGDPSLPVLLSGTAERQALYLRGSGSRQLVFRYTLTDADGAHSSLLVEPNSLAPNGGSIHGVDNMLNAAIEHEGAGAIYVQQQVVDEAAPELRSAVVDGAALTLTYDEDLNMDVTPPASAFAVNVDGASRSTDSVSALGAAVTLTLATAVEAGDMVTVDYTVPTGESANKLQDTSGNTAASFSGQAVTNSTSSGQGTGRISQEEAANSPATGGPGIIGSVRDGETLTATTDGIADEDGLTDADFAYQWLHHDLATNTDTDIPGARGSTYTVTNEDEAIKVRVSFTDDAGNDESLTSYMRLYAPPLVIPDEEPQQQAANTPATGEPGIDGSPGVGRTLTATTSDIEDEDGLSGAVYAYQWVRHDPAGETDADIEEAVGAAYTMTDDDEGKAIKVRVTFTDDAVNEESLTSRAVFAPPLIIPDEEEQEAAETPLTAAIHDAPESHDGQEDFTFELRFSEEPKEGFISLTLRDHAFTVTGGTMEGARQLDGGSDTPNIRWEITVSPDSNANVTVKLPVTEDCEAQGAICTDDGRALSGPLKFTVKGPPLTASTVSVPTSHNGSGEFRFRIAFSEEFSLSYLTLRDDHVFTVEGGKVTGARRLVKGSNIGWEIVVQPDSNGDVTVKLPVTEDCDAQGAICTDDGRMLSSPLEFTVTGPGQ